MVMTESLVDASAVNYVLDLWNLAQANLEPPEIVDVLLHIVADEDDIALGTQIITETS